MKPRFSLPLSMICCLAGSSLQPFSVSAQSITSDGTLPTPTEVTENGNISEITGGTARGSNLFHSFRDFSVGAEGTADFLNADNISHIFSRVTGGNISNIDGLLRTNNASLFLINPAGIMFGSGARLDLGGGSFYGSSADSILFDEVEFSATDLENPPLLTINAPIGLNLRDNPEPITVQSVVDDVGLEVSTGETLALIGGDIEIDGGKITAPGGRVELGGLSAAGTVNFNESGGLTFSDSLARSNVSFSNGASVNVFSEGGGAIAINSQNLELTEESSLNAGIAADSGTPEAQAGNIVVNAINEMSLDNSFVKNLVETGSVGNAGNINITTGNLSLINGAQVSTNTAGQGDAGTVTINARGNIAAEGENLNFEDSSESNSFSNQSGIFSQVEATGKGNAGGIDIVSEQLTLKDGASIDTTTLGVGNGGTITIQAADTVALEGEDNDGFTSAISSNVFFNAVGNGGEIKLDTGNLSLNNGAIITATTSGTGEAGAIEIEATDTITADGVSKSGFRSGIFTQVTEDAQGNAGEIIIDTAKLNLSNGGQINADTDGRGNAGLVKINAADTITADGVAPDTNNFLRQSGVFSQVSEGGVGNAGNIEITTEKLSVMNGAGVAVDNQGQGNGGNLLLQTSSLNLDNNAFISATTNSGEGGNTNLQIEDILVMRNNSSIRAGAFGDAVGGNININAGFIVAFPSQISNNGNDIIARAEPGKGGNINIGTQAILGIEERKANPGNGTNDIDASSEFRLEGFTQPDFFVEPDAQIQVIETDAVVAGICDPVQARKNIPAGKENSFVVKGKGGIPPEPTEPLNSDAIWINGQIANSNPQAYHPDIKPIKTTMGDVYPARGIITTESGEIILTPYSTGGIDTRTPHIQPNCTQS